MMKMILKLFFTISLLASFTACSDNPDHVRIKDYTAQVTMQLNGLVKALNNGELSNATILVAYADKFKTMKPAFAGLADAFKLQATANSPAILDYKKRLKTVRDNPELIGDDQAVIKEIYALGWSTKKDMYNDSLLDPINTISDLTDGELPRINTPRKTDHEKPATQMVGNPQYGQWQTNSSGQSLWAWYGQYALISSLLGGHRYSYNDWHYNRGWSQYNDYGRDKVSSPRQRSQYNQTVKKNEPSLKQYGQKTGRTQSSYASRSNPKYQSTVSTRARKAATASRYSSSYSSRASSSRGSSSRYGSSYGRSSSGSRYGSSYGGSLRSNSYGSRSRFGGK